MYNNKGYIQDLYIYRAIFTILFCLKSLYSIIQQIHGIPKHDIDSVRLRFNSQSIGEIHVGVFKWISSEIALMCQDGNKEKELHFG